jgi:hypothetical protein
VGATLGDLSDQYIGEAREEGEQKTAESSGTLSIIAVFSDCFFLSGNKQLFFQPVKSKFLKK